MAASSTFRATHTAPAGGLPTWSAPNPAATADNRLGPQLEVQVLGETNGWAHILCSNGWTAWVDSRYLVPIPAAAPYAAPAAKRRGGCRIFLLGCLGLVVVLILVGVGIFIALRTGAITTNKLLNLVGQGPAVIEVDNFRDDTISVNIDSLKSAGGSAGSGTTPGSASPSTASSGSFSLFGEGLVLKSFDVQQKHVQNPGKYRLTFIVHAGAALGTCTLSIRGGDHYQFVTLPSGIVVSRQNDPSKKGADYALRTSTLCQH